MLYNMFFTNNLYLCGVNTRKKRRCLTRFPKRGEHKNENDYGKVC